MSERKWTPEQSDAITARGGSLLVSAAAGSGKTAVLVERIVKLLTDEEAPARPDELLVVTFTNAAAAQMRERISDAVDRLIAQEPENYFLRSIKTSLPDAQISTIDSFCIRLVRENFNAAEISPDFTVLDDSEMKILSSRAMNDALDELSETAPDVYDMLNSMTSYKRDDSALAEKIRRLYDYSLSHPFPDKWLDDVCLIFEDTDDICSGVWGKVIIENLRVSLGYALDMMRSGLKILEKCPEVGEKYSPAFSDAEKKYLELLEKTENPVWDELCAQREKYEADKLPRAPKGFAQDAVKLCAADKFKKASAAVENALGCFCADTRENRDDLERLRPLVKGLVLCVRDYDRRFGEMKRERGGYSFSDIMHKALSLLTCEIDGKAQKSPLAKSLSEKYREILIDEYQDVNDAQDMLFKLISRDGENLFAVGDVKQSIYGFRLAMPDIFVEKVRRYDAFDRKTQKYPAKIFLSKNFRSRKGILDAVNFLFSQIMSEKAGDMDYTPEIALHYGGGYPDDDSPAADICFVGSQDDASAAQYAALTVKKMISSGVTVHENGGKRRARYSDFCVLLRSTKKRSEIYEKAFEKAGVPVYGEKKAGLFDCAEVSVFMSLLKAIDNPGDDLSLLSLMFSPMYGFTADEAAEIRINAKRTNLYAALSQSGCEKAKKLVSELEQYRKTASSLDLESFVRTLLDVTCYAETVSALDGGPVRKNNLLMLCEIASSYESRSGGGLSGFIRYVAKAVENGAAIPSASALSAEADVVRIMSVHKSKGLEFPFVILADCEKSFNLLDLRDDMIISSKTGLGMTVQDNENLKKYPSLSLCAAKIAQKKMNMSEELRVLYVAMTRAREKLVCISQVPDAAAALQKLGADVTGLKKPNPYSVMNAGSCMQWLLLGYLFHPDAHGTADFDCLIERDYSAEYSRMNFIFDKIPEAEAFGVNENAAKADPNLTKELMERIEYEYPYKMPKDARPKRIASDFEDKKASFSSEYFAVEKPDFMLSGKLSPAQVGTANHLFLQRCDFCSTDASRELERMKKEHILDDRQAAAVRIDKMNAFLSGELCSRILRADKVYREKEFTVSLPIDEVYPDADDSVKDETILVLGKCDMVFVENGEAVVVDYKTDRSKTEDEFIAEYAGQLRMYALAIEEILCVKVKERIIYSLQLEKSIFC